MTSLGRWSAFEKIFFTDSPLYLPQATVTTAGWYNLAPNGTKPMPSCEPYQADTTSIVFSLLYALIFAVGIFTNLIVICIFIFKSGFRQYRNSFFINLSIADILVLLCCIPISITDLFSPNSWFYGFVYCKLYYFLEYCVTSVSSLTIILIGIERYLSLVSPVAVSLIFHARFDKPFFDIIAKFLEFN
jgi:hypothetical protein